MLFDLSGDCLPLSIAVDQQADLVLLLLGLLGIFLDHDGVSCSIDTVYHAEVTQELGSCLLVDFHLPSELLDQGLQLTLLPDIVENVDEDESRCD